MLEKLSQSSGNVLGYKVAGTLLKEDYATLTAEVEALLEQEETMSLLLDLEELAGEEVGAWGADLRFGRKYRKRIEKTAIVGDKKWQEWMAVIADPFWAREAEFFTTGEREAAWEWLQT
jgi:hypothetical protein